MTDRSFDRSQMVRTITLVFGLVAIAGAILVAIHFATDIDVRLFVTDPAEIARVREYAGFYNNVAILVLWTGAVIAATSAWLGVFPKRTRREFVASLAVMTGGIAIDDWFMLHEIGGYWLALAMNADNVPVRRQSLEGYVFAIMVMAAIAWLVWMRREILHSPWPLLLLGILGFGASVAMDIGPQFIDVLAGSPLWLHTTWAIGEEMAKYVGIGGLSMYAIMTAAPYLRR